MKKKKIIKEIEKIIVKYRIRSSTSKAVVEINEDDKFHDGLSDGYDNMINSLEDLIQKTDK